MYTFIHIDNYINTLLTYSLYFILLPTGRHTVEILYAGNAIMGSPFYVEIYDPNKIRVEGVTNGVVGQSISFDILRHEAGKAELGLTIRSPTGRDVMYQTVPIPQGDRITYVPQEPGAYLIYITYGGLDVPGKGWFYHRFY